MKAKNTNLQYQKGEITVKWIRRNKDKDFFKITNNGNIHISELPVSYQEYPKVRGMTSEDVYNDLF